MNIAQPERVPLHIFCANISSYPDREPLQPALAIHSKSAAGGNLYGGAPSPLRRDLESIQIEPGCQGVLLSLANLQSSLHCIYLPPLKIYPLRHVGEVAPYEELAKGKRCRERIGSAAESQRYSVGDLYLLNIQS